MADPSEKNASLEESLKNVFGFDRTASIKTDVCIPAPIGCGKPAPPESFRDALSVREYTISGL